MPMQAWKTLPRLATEANIILMPSAPHRGEKALRAGEISPLDIRAVTPLGKFRCGVPWLGYYHKDTARALSADNGHFNRKEILA